MSDSAAFPPTIQVADGTTMTFLRNQTFGVRLEISATAKPTSTPKGLSFFVPPHWHESHDEFHRVLKGRVEFTIGSVTKVYTPEDGEVTIPRGTLHSIRVSSGQEVIIEERSDPIDDEKELFFRNFFANGPPENQSMLQIMQMFYLLDGRPGLPGHIKWLERAFTTCLGGFLAPMFGYKLRYPSLKKT